MGVSPFKGSTCLCGEERDELKRKAAEGELAMLKAAVKNMPPSPKKGQRVSEEKIAEAFKSLQRKYKVLDARDIGCYTILKLQYNDCTNYEGIKILVYENLNKAGETTKQTKGNEDEDCRSID